MLAESRNMRLIEVAVGAIGCTVGNAGTCVLSMMLWYLTGLMLPATAVNRLEN